MDLQTKRQTSELTESKPLRYNVVPVRKRQDRRISNYFEMRKKECQRERINQKFAAVYVCTVSASAWPRLMGALCSNAAVYAAVIN
jgi:hypothetical protein